MHVSSSKSARLFWFCDLTKEFVVSRQHWERWNPCWRHETNRSDRKNWEQLSKEGNREDVSVRDKSQNHDVKRKMQWDQSSAIQTLSLRRKWDRCSITWLREGRGCEEEPQKKSNVAEAPRRFQIEVISYAKNQIIPTVFGTFPCQWQQFLKDIREYIHFRFSEMVQLVSIVLRQESWLRFDTNMKQIAF